MTDYLGKAHPRLAESLRKVTLAVLPTPVSTASFEMEEGTRSIAVKRDDVSNPHYGGNKIRKLEYILKRAQERGARRVATFGAVGSNHALATALFAAECGLECTCFLAAQKQTPNIARTLNMHRYLGTEIVRYGGSVDRLSTFRRYLQGRRSWVVPLGGSSWLGTVGFISAGFELAAQVAAGELEMPERIYIANGTMGSSAGLVLGLALADMPTELHAVRVVDDRFASPEKFERLMRKTATLLHRLDSSIPVNIVDRAKYRWRDAFFAGGYARSDAVTSDAVALARQDMGLTLETTYTGKAMSALLHDLKSREYEGGNYLFWNTYNSRQLPVSGERPATADNIPREFMSYFD